MAKRMTDTEKWKKQWFRKLEPKYKCFWFYLLDNCNLAGIWDVDFETAEFFIGSELDVDYIRTAFEEQYSQLEGGKRWFVFDFIKFQYGELSYDSKPHIAVLKELERLNLLSIGLAKGYITLKDKDKDIDKEKDKEYFPTLFNANLPLEHYEVWKEWLDYCYSRDDIKLNKTVISIWLKLLRSNPTQINEIIKTAMQGNWKGLHEVKNGQFGKSSNRNSETSSESIADRFSPEALAKSKYHGKGKQSPEKI